MARKFWSSWPFSDTQAERLEANIPKAKMELTNIEQNHSDPKIRAKAKIALENLKLAQEALDKRRVEQAWRYYQDGSRVRIYDFTLDAIKSEAISLLDEANAEIAPSWRRGAIAKLLGDPVTVPPSLESLEEALFVRDEHYNNKYQRIFLIKQQLFWLYCILVGVLLTIVILTYCSFERNLPLAATVAGEEKPSDKEKPSGPGDKQPKALTPTENRPHLFIGDRQDPLLAFICLTQEKKTTPLPEKKGQQKQQPHDSDGNKPNGHKPSPPKDDHRKQEVDKKNEKENNIKKTESDPTPKPPDGPKPQKKIANLPTVALVFLFGALGGLFSTLISLMREPQEFPIPKHLLEKSFIFIRPLVGGVSAFFAFIFLNSGMASYLLNPELVKLAVESNMIAIAILAGFSERLVLGAMEKMTK